MGRALDAGDRKLEGVAGGERLFVCVCEREGVAASVWRRARFRKAAGAQVLLRAGGKSQRAKTTTALLCDWLASTYRRLVSIVGFRVPLPPSRL